MSKGNKSQTPLPVECFSRRRKSVFAEHYDPGADDEDDNDETMKITSPKSEDQRKRLAESVQDIVLFRGLDKDQMKNVIDAMIERKVHVGDVIIKQGDDGDYFYVIEEGTFHTSFKENGKDERNTEKYENCGSFGELALLYNLPRTASVRAMTDGSLWAIDRQTFRKILLKSAFRKRKMYESLIEQVPMLKALKPFERMNLADALVSQTLSPAEKIIRQGDAADGMYFVEFGVVRITVLDDNCKEVEINRIVKGGYFGELALVTHKPRAASAYAVVYTKVAFLDVEAFERLLGPCMQIMKRNIEDYEAQIVNIFGSKPNVNDIR